MGAHGAERERGKVCAKRPQSSQRRAPVPVQRGTASARGASGPGPLPTLWLESGARPAAPPCLRCRRRRRARLPMWEADVGCRSTRVQPSGAAPCAMSQVPRRRAAGAASDTEAAVDNSLAPQMPRRAWTPGPRSMRGAAAAWDVLHLRWRRQHTRRQRRRVRFPRTACSLCWPVSKTRPTHGFLERRLPCWTCLALWLC